MTQTIMYSVGEAAERSGFSVDTLRYYERLGLVDAIERDGGGRRRYTADDLEWLGLLACLRDTGMPVREMQNFAELVRAGDHNWRERRELLQAHRERVRAHIADLTERLDRIQYKIDYYREREEA